VPAITPPLTNNNVIQNHNIVSSPVCGAFGGFVAFVVVVVVGVVVVVVGVVVVVVGVIVVVVGVVVVVVGIIVVVVGGSSAGTGLVTILV